MEIKILEKNEQPLLSRIEYNLSLIFGKATPSKEELKKKLSSDLGVDEKLIVIKSIFTQFGKSQGTALAYSYFSEDELKSIEPKDKKGAKEGAAPKEAPKEDKPAKEEKPAEAPKEEKPKEEK